jgi:O-antigen ligase
LTALFFAGVLILMIIFFGLRRDEAKRSVRTFALAATFSLVPSIVGIVAPIAPVLGGVGKGGGYAGYFPWNSSAGLCAAAALLSVALTYRALGFAWWQLPAAAAALLMLSLSKSATSLFALAASAGLFGLVVLLRRTGTQLRPLVILALTIAGFLLWPKATNLMSREQLSDASQRTESLSGRTQIWQWALDGISESPYVGYGTDFWQSFGACSRSAHNGFLDVALNAGLPAALALVAIVALAAARLISTMGLLLPFLAFGVVTNFALSQLTVPAIPALALWLAVGTTVRIGGIRTESVKVAGAAVSRTTGSGSSQTITART